MKKNDDIRIKIDAVTGTGSGIGRVDNMAVFVAGAAAGDEVIAHIIKVKKNYAVATLKQVCTPSADRVAVDCAVFGRCGGCAYRHINYAAQCKIKSQSVEDAIRRIGGIPLSPLPIMAAEKTTGYRNKAQYPATNTKNGLAFGFYAGHTHRVVENSGCLLQPPIFKTALEAIKIWADTEKVQAYEEQTAKGLLRHVLLRFAEKTGQLMVVPVINGTKLPNEQGLVDLLQQKLGSALATVCVNINTQQTNVVLGEQYQTLFGSGYIVDQICGVNIRIAPQSFYQVNRTMAEKMYQKAAEYITPEDKTVIDLFCGTGTIGLSVMKTLNRQDIKLYGVEIVPQAVEDAKKNAAEAGIKNAQFICGDAAKAAKDLYAKKISADTVILDPPRKGCAPELIETVAAGFAPQKVIYISCDPATLARDTALFNQKGYVLKEYTPVDLFPGTAHVETVCLLTRETTAHDMKLNPEPFEMIKSGNKTIELRLFDEKRQKIKVGDRIVFTETVTSEKLSVKVEKLHRFNNFDELYKSLPLLKCGYTEKTVADAKPSDMEEYYSLEEQKKYGVVGIEISRPELITDETVALLSRA